MNKYLQMYKRMPSELRLLLILIVASIPIILVRNLLPQGIFPWVLGGLIALFGTLMLVRLLIRGRNRSQGSRLDKEISGQDSGPSRQELAEKDKEYKQKWADGVGKLKKANLSLYELPWYIIIGEPGGGKTMTLLNSGMDFPMGKEELSGFGGTRNYNWWFTNTAVILDTAGRLVFEQEGTSDRYEWEAFLKVLKRRRRCPINGVIVALPADKLMSDTAEQRDQNASIIRDRLRQIQTLLGVRFPVFLLITKSDLIAGFTEFYNELDSLERNQLFGWSRPGDFDTPYEPKEFSGNFDELYKRVHELRLNFLSRKTSDIEAGWIYTFPEAFGALKDRIQDYVDVIFSKNIFAEPLFFRGFYFTSSLQEGKPIIDILGEHLSDEEMESLEGIFPQSRAFFIHDFYTRKVAKEQGMVFRSQKHINRMRLLKKSTLYIGMPVLLVFTVFVVLAYFAYNKTVTAPRDVVWRAARLVQKYRDVQEKQDVWTVKAGYQEDAADDLAKAIKLSEELNHAIDQVKNPTGLASFMFASIGEDAERNIRMIQRELVGYCLLRPEVARVEQAMIDREVPITSDTVDDFSVTLSTYISWYFNQGSSSWDEFRRFLPDKKYLMDDVGKHLELFSDGSLGVKGRLAGGITSNNNHQQKIITEALARARDYWAGTADIDRHGDYAWWAILLARYDQAKESYQELLDLQRQFNRVNSKDNFLKLAQKCLGTFPQRPPVDSTEEGSVARTSRVNARLLQLIREHLRDAPRTKEGQIVLLDELIEQNRKAANQFWEKCLAAIPTSEDGSVSDYAEVLAGAIQGFQKSFEDKMEASKSLYLARIADIEDILVPRPRHAPEEYEFTDSAERVESVLSYEVAGRLQELSTSVEPSLEMWNAQLKSLASQDPPDTRFDLSPDWQVTQLKRLVNDVAAARNRYEGQFIIAEIQKQLESRPDQGLAAFMDGQDNDNRARTLRFEGLKNRHAASFILSTARAKQTLEKTLAGAVDLDSSWLNELLSDSMQQYVQHYLAAWSEAYGEYRMNRVAEFAHNWPSNWEEYRRWIRDYSEDARREYRDHLDAMLKHAIAVFRSPSGGHDPQSSSRAELMQYLDMLDWPKDSHLEPVFKELVAADRIPSIKGVLRNWRKFEDQIDDFRFTRLEDLTREPIVFPQLPRVAGEDNPLADEWFTRQMQYIVDFGQWLLWSDIYDKVDNSHLDKYAKNPPFIFANGSFDKVDPLKLKATLRALTKVKAFSDLQIRQLGSDQQVGSVTGKHRMWLKTADLWYEFLQHESYEIQLAYETIAETEPDKGGPQNYYTRVVFRLPGLETVDGNPRRELSFSAARSSLPKTYRWRPKGGTLTVALSSLTVELEGRGAEMEPRVLELPHAEYGLIELMRKYGTLDGENQDQWVVKLSKNINEIQGLEDERTDDPIKWIAFRIKFTDPKGGSPPAMDWPDFRTLKGPKPKPPWKQTADDL